MRIGLLMGRYAPTDKSHMPEVVRLLAEWGATAEPVHLGDELIDLARIRVDYDLYVLKDKSELAMRVAAALHTAGAALLNPYPASATLRDRIVKLRVLQAAGVPAPKTFVASHVDQLRAALEHGPLVIKPHRKLTRSAPGEGIHVVRDRAELAALPPISEPVFAQRYHASDGPDRKIYSIGSEIFGVLRAWPARTHREKLGQAFTPDPELVDITRRCGAALGIDLFGVTVVQSGGKSYVVDMTSIPGFKGVPDAPRRLAEYIYAATERALRGAPLVSGVPTPVRDEPAVRPPVVRAAPPPARRTLSAEQALRPRVAMYSQGMVGFGHIRRNASIAQALRGSPLQPSIVLIAEAWQAGALPMPPGVDCVTLPALRREADGGYNPRFLADVSDLDVISLRARVIRSAIKTFVPDVLVVDCLPVGVAGELTRTLARLRKGGNTRCVLGLRDVLQDAETVRRDWSERAHMDAIRDYYDAIWVYGDPAVYDPVREYDLPDYAAAKVRYTGYLDQRPRLEFAEAQTAAVLASLPPGRVALCVVGGGHDGGALAEAFVAADFPPDTTAVMVTGPLMPWETRQRLHRAAQRRTRFELLEFVPDPVPLIERADRVIAMGGYNTVCEVLSFEKPALIVPRVTEPEQGIRARRMQELGLLDVLHPDELSPQALTEWLARDPAPPPPPRGRVDLGGLTRIPGLLAELLGVPAGPLQPAASAAAEMGLT